MNFNVSAQPEIREGTEIIRRRNLEVPDISIGINLLLSWGLVHFVDLIKLDSSYKPARNRDLLLSKPNASTISLKSQFMSI
jgi:hypothetical protein